MALGFHNVRALDIISYSPWVDLGDMHAMPYADNQFGIVIMGWVLAYSHMQKKAAQEAIRVARNGGIIAVGVDVPHKDRTFFHKLESVQEILSLFEPHVDYVYFSQDRLPHPCDKWEMIVVFSVKKVRVGTPVSTIAPTIRAFEGCGTVQDIDVGTLPVKLRT